MSLSKAELAIWRKAMAAGAGPMAPRLTEGMCAYLLARIVSDLGLSSRFANVPAELPDLFAAKPGDLFLATSNTRDFFERVIHDVPDAVTHFACLVSLLKSRLKYANILSGQPLPTMDQVGPRGLLQYGTMTPRSLATFLSWRKWFFDIDDRAGQETGYLFEPVIAASVGGLPITSTKSPVRSHRDGKGRQVDCLLDQDAYEVKIRVTIAASGQGRWREELDFPVDCKASGYRPVLVVLDGTTNPKLNQLVAAFERAGGATHVGALAWAHLESLAGETMSRFLDIYVRRPLATLLAAAPKEFLPELVVRDSGDRITLTIAGEEISIARDAQPTDDSGDEMPGDVADLTQGG